MNGKPNERNNAALSEQDIRIKRKLFEFETRLAELRRIQKHKMFGRDLIRNDTNQLSTGATKEPIDGIAIACGIATSCLFMFAFKSLAITPVGFFAGYKARGWIEKRK